jgi:carbohydrate-selective porin OprB
MKRNIFITVFIAIAVSVGFFFSQGDNTIAQEPVKSKLPKAQRIEGALEWRQSLLADPATGEFDVNLFYNAMDKADELKWIVRFKLGACWSR